LKIKVTVEEGLDLLHLENILLVDQEDRGLGNEKPILRVDLVQDLVQGEKSVLRSDRSLPGVEIAPPFLDLEVAVGLVKILSLGVPDLPISQLLIKVLQRGLWLYL